MKASPVRGVRDIHTRTQRISDAANPHRKYLLMAILELERAHRSKEKDAASRRIKSIENRVSEIERQQAGLLDAAKTALAGPLSARKTTEEADAESEKTQGFELNY